MRSVMVLVVLSIVSPASGWRLVGLAGQRVVAITNASRDFCYAATDSVLYRGDRYNWYQPVYRYGSHSDLRVRVKEGQQHTNMPVCLAWGWGSRSDGVWLSTDNGSSWQVETYFLYPCAFDAVWGYYLPQGLMLVGSDTLDNPPLRSTDGGTSWQPCGFGLPGNQVRCFAINGENRRYALCGTRGHGLYLSQDTGATWQFCGPDSSADVLDATWFESMVLVLAKVRDTTAVWSTDHTGRNWVRELLLPAGTGLSYNRACQVGGLGIYARDSIWRPDTCGLACRAVRCISSTFFGAFWYAGTDSGVFHLDMTPGAEENPKSQSPRPELQGTIVHGVLFLRADSRLHTGYRAELVDATGRRVLALVAGPNEVQHLAPGVYFVRRASDADCTASGVSRVVIVR